MVVILQNLKLLEVRVFSSLVIKVLRPKSPSTVSKENKPPETRTHDPVSLSGDLFKISIKYDDEWSFFLYGSSKDESTTSSYVLSPNRIWYCSGSLKTKQKTLIHTRKGRESIRRNSNPLLKS